MKNQINNKKRNIDYFLLYLKDFYIVQEKFLAYNFLNYNYIDNLNLKEIINEILTKIFFNELFNKYTSKFSLVYKKSSKAYLTENILNGKKYSLFIDFLEKETFKTHILYFMNNLSVVFITDIIQKKKEI